MTTRRLLPPLAVTTAALTVLFAGPQADGKGKPEPGNQPTGEIYFGTYVEELQEARLAVMSPDGTGKTLLPAGVPAESRPSFGLYDGARWHVTFTETPGQFHPDGQARGILEIVREDGVARVTILNDPDMWYNDATWTWSKGDEWISFAGYRWDHSVSPPEPLASALYAVPIAFDTAGPFPLSGPIPLVDAGFDFLSSANRVFPGIYGHDWSPDGSRIAFQRLREGTLQPDLYTVDLISGVESLLALVARDPSWSPDGQRIAFSSTTYSRDTSPRTRTIETIAADDTNESTRQILYEARASSGATHRQVRVPHWSPTGDHLAFAFVETGGGFVVDIYRMTADGNDVQNLTDDILDASILGWR